MAAGVPRDGVSAAGAGGFPVAGADGKGARVGSTAGSAERANTVSGDAMGAAGTGTGAAAMLDFSTNRRVVAAPGSCARET